MVLINGFTLLEILIFHFRLAKHFKVVSLNQVTAHYRNHGNNETIKNQDLEINELTIWYNENLLKNDNMDNSFNYLKNKITYLEVNNIFNDKKNKKNIFKLIYSLYPSFYFLKILMKLLFPKKFLNSKLGLSIWKIYQFYFLK